MKKLLCHSLAAWALIAAQGCGGTASDPGAPYKAWVLQLQPLASTATPGTVPTFSLAQVTYKNMNRLKDLSGDYFSFVGAATVTESKVTGSIVETSGSTGGTDPVLRYRLQDGAMVPLDYETLAQFSAAYLYDTVFDNLKTMTGVDPADVKAKAGKYKIFFEPTILTASGTVTGESTTKLNAAYVPTNYQFLLFRRSTLENVPLAANLQVITHEFGHAMWEYLFDGGKMDTSGRYAYEYVFYGLNEGWADFFSYTLTGSANILYASIDIAEEMKQRNFADSTLTYADFSKKNATNCAHDFYCIGIMWARALYEASKDSSIDVTSLTSRSAFLTAAATALSQTRTAMDTTKLPTLTVSDVTKIDAWATSAEYDGKVLGTFFDAFLSKLTNSTYKTKLCSKLVTIFGATGFPTTHRGQCP